MTAANLSRSIIASMGGIADQVTLYPVRAEDVDAYLGAGLEGTAARGVMEVRAIVASDGEVGVATELVSFKTDVTTAAPIVPRRWSIEYEGVRYDVLRKTPDHPGGIDVHLQEYR